jgi:hypothetical protein
MHIEAASMTVSSFPFKMSKGLIEHQPHLLELTKSSTALHVIVSQKIASARMS